MESFSTLLRKFIGEQDISVYKLANESGVNRTVIQNVMAGKKKLPQSGLFNIIDTDCFTIAQVHYLNEAYYTEKYGANTLKRFDMITAGLKGQIRTNLQKEVLVSPMKIDDNTICINSRKDLLSAIKAIMDKGTENFFSNFDFCMGKINRLVHSACESGNIENFFHCVSYKYDETPDDIETMFNMIHYAEDGFITYIGDSLYFGNKKIYFMVTDEHLLIFDENAEMGILSTNDSMGSFLSDKIEGIKRSCSQEVFITDNAIDYMEKIDALTATQAKECSTVGYDGSVCPTYVTENMVAEMATDLIKSIPAMAKNISSHFEISLGGVESIEHIICSFDSIHRFVETGIQESFSPQFAKPMSRQNVGKYLRLILGNKSVKWQLTNPIYFDSKYAICTQNNKTRLSTSSCRDLEQDGYVGKTIYSTLNKNLFDDFKKYYEYLGTTEMTFSTKASSKILEREAEIIEAE